MIFWSFSEHATLLYTIIFGPDDPILLLCYTPTQTQKGLSVINGTSRGSFAYLFRRTTYKWTPTCLQLCKMEKCSLNLQHEAWFMAINTERGPLDALTSVLHTTHSNTWTPLPFFFNYFAFSENRVPSESCTNPCWMLIFFNHNLSPCRFLPHLTSLPHERSHAGPHSRSGWDELAQMAVTYRPVLLESCSAPSAHVNKHAGCFLYLSSVGLHETLALLTSQLRPDANHKEDMVFLKDVFSERSLGCLMKVRELTQICLIPQDMHL